MFVDQYQCLARSPPVAVPVRNSRLCARGTHSFVPRLPAADLIHRELQTSNNTSSLLGSARFGPASPLGALGREIRVAPLVRIDLEPPLRMPAAKIS
jgi:hypothetical protein